MSASSYSGQNWSLEDLSSVPPGLTPSEIMMWKQWEQWEQWEQMMATRGQHPASQNEESDNPSNTLLTKIVSYFMSPKAQNAGQK